MVSKPKNFYVSEICLHHYACHPQFSYAFYDNNCIRSTQIGDSVNYIGASAFEQCSNLNEIMGMSQVTYLGSDAFGQTAWLENCEEDFLAAGENVLVKCLSDEEEVTVPSVKKVLKGAESEPIM